MTQKDRYFGINELLYFPLSVWDDTPALTDHISETLRALQQQLLWFFFPFKKNFFKLNNLCTMIATIFFCVLYGHVTALVL